MFLAQSPLFSISSTIIDGVRIDISPMHPFSLILWDLTINFHMFVAFLVPFIRFILSSFQLWEEILPLLLIFYFYFYRIKLFPICDTVVVSLHLSIRFLILVLFTTTSFTAINLPFTDLIFYFKNLISAYFFKVGSFGKLDSGIT